MNKRNLILQAALVSAFGAMAVSANAGTLTGAVSFAAEIAGPTSTTALAIKPVALVYTFNTPGGIVVNPGGTIYAYERLAGGLYSTAPLAGEFALGGGITGLTAAVGALSADSTTVRISLNNSTTVNVVIGVGGTLTWTPTAGAVNNVNSTLATVGGTVTAQASVASSNSGTAMNTGTALAADLDNGLSNTLAIATSATAITTAVAASSTLAVVETQKIDLTATTPGSRFTAPGVTLSNANSATILNLGTIKFTNVTSKFTTDGATAYTIIANGTATTLSGTVTGVFKGTSTMALMTDAACTTTIAAGSAGTLNAGLTTFTFAGGTLPTSGTVNYICYTVPATTGVIPLTTPTASFTFTKTTTTDAATTASGTLYALTNNGQTYDVRNYVPAAATGYSTFVRVINTGIVSAAVSVAKIDDATGVVGTSGILATLAAGQATNFTPAQIEAVTGAIASTSRPRLRITAPTNALNVQTFLFDSAGNFADMTGAQ